MSEWQPISPETPRDTLLLVWGNEGFSIAEYDSGLATWYAMAAGELAHDYDTLIKANPTHWMPLPEPPQR